MKRKVSIKIEYLEHSLAQSLDLHGIEIDPKENVEKWLLTNYKGKVEIGAKNTIVDNIFLPIFLIVLLLIQLPFLLIANLVILVRAILNGIPFEAQGIVLPEKRIGCIDNKIKIEIRHREHAPPHFHVIIDDSDYSISIMTGELIQGEIKNKIHRTAINEWYNRNKELLIKAWNESRPTDCPVGKIPT